MTTDSKMYSFILRVSECTDPKEAIKICEEADLNAKELLYGCIAASCANKEQINLLEGQLVLAENCIFK